MKEKINKNFEYNPEIDSLTIYHNNAKNEPVLGSFSLGDLVFDIGVGGTFISLEIDNASKIFNVQPQEFSKIKNANIKTMIKGNTIFLFYLVLLENKEFERALMIPKDKIQLTA